MCRKSCLDCAFCLRYKEYWISHFPYFKKSFWQNVEDNLTEREISELRKNGTASFLFEEKREQDKWIAEYKTKENEAIQKEIDRRITEAQQSTHLLGINNIPDSIYSYHKLNDIFGNKYDRYEEFGMKEMPSSPEHDYLACWKEQWSSDNNTEILKTLKSRECKFFYPLNEKGEKTLSACDEEVLIRMDNKKFWKGILWGALTTICGGALLRILG